MLMTVGRELWIGRVRNGMTQRQVGAAVGRSPSWVSRVERGTIRGVPASELMAVAASVGLRLSLKTYPSRRRPLDGAQLALLDRFHRRLGSDWHRQLEKVMPILGDLRAIDELIWTDSCSCAVEAITRLADLQGQLRPARAKQRDAGAKRLIFLVAATHANRRMLHEIGPALEADFPIGTRHALRALADGHDPGGDCLILL
jgi:transcriptional regulator with XRE-family HTH domain